MSGGRFVERQARRAAELRLFVQQYARPAPKRGEPNDRRYSRRVAQRLERMNAQALDHLLRDGE